MSLENERAYYKGVVVGFGLGFIFTTLLCILLLTFIQINYLWTF